MKNRVVFIVFEEYGEWQLDSTIIRCYTDGNKTFMEYSLLSERDVKLNKQTGELTLMHPAMYTGNKNLNRLEDIPLISDSLRLVVELSVNESKRLFAYLERCHIKNWELETKVALSRWKGDPHRLYSTGEKRWRLVYWANRITIDISGGENSEPKKLNSFLRYLNQYNPFKATS